MLGQQRRPVHQRPQPGDEGIATGEAVFAAVQRGGHVLGQAAGEQHPVVAIERAEVAVLELPDLLDLEVGLNCVGHRWCSAGGYLRLGPRGYRLIVQGD
ncbi:hypothetical protein D3C72_2088880 [compost metagenome]